MAGLPKKYAKMGFAKGWAAFKRAKAATARKLKGRSNKRKSTSTTRKTSTSGVRKVAAKKAPTTRRRRVTLMSNQTINLLVKGGTVAGSILGSTWAINYTPWIRDRKPWQKALAQAAGGLLLWMFSRRPLVRLAALGLVSSAGITAALPYINQKMFGRRFSPSELAQLQTMGVPTAIGPSNGMGVPTSIGRRHRRSMGIPTSLGNSYFNRATIKSSNYAY